MAYYHRDGYGFLANPRTASRTVAQVLKRLDFRRDGPHHASLSRSGVKASFCVVRHHADCLVSWSHHLSKPLEDADDLVELIEALPANSYGGWWELERRLFPHAWGPNGAAELDVLYFEHLEADLTAWLRTHHFRVPDELPHVGRSERKPTSDVITPAMLEVIVDHYGDEMEALGYEPRVVGPVGGGL